MPAHVLGAPTTARMARVLVALLLCAAAGWSDCAAAAALPAIGGSGPPEHHPGKIIWADLVTPDLEAAERFYTGLFGWSFTTAQKGPTDYAIAFEGGRPIAGLLQKPIPLGEHHQPAWLTFIAVRDADAADRMALAHGAKSLAAPKSYPGRGRQAVIADPEGAIVAVLASSSGDPPDVLVEEGQWIWTSLLVNDPQASASFYKTVFGYEVFDLPSDDGSVHELLASDDYARASVNSLPAGGHRHPHWINFVRVPDAAAAAVKAVNLGGRVLVAPFEDRHGGKVAVVADPSGAPIGLMEWAEDTANQGEAK